MPNRKNTTQAHRDRGRLHIGNYIMDDMQLYFNLSFSFDPLMKDVSLKLTDVSSRHPTWLDIKSKYFIRTQMEAQNLVDDLGVNAANDIVTTAINQRIESGPENVEVSATNSENVEVSESSECESINEETNHMDIPLDQQKNHAKRRVRPMYALTSAIIECEKGKIMECDSKVSDKYSSVVIHYKDDGTLDRKSGIYSYSNRRRDIQILLEHTHTCSMYCGMDKRIQEVLASRDKHFSRVVSILSSCLRCQHILPLRRKIIDRKVFIYSSYFKTIEYDVSLFENFENRSLEQLLDLKAALAMDTSPPHMQLAYYQAPINMNYVATGVRYI